MLALSETKVTSGSSYEEIVPETRVSTSCITTHLNQVEMAGDSLNILARSKSVSDVSKAQLPQELTETTGSLKSSWKVSNLFSFKNKKASKEKRDTSQYSSSMSQLATPSSVTLPSEDCRLPLDALQQQSIIPGEEELTTPKPLEAGNTSEKQDELSPVSVLFPPFEEEGVSTPECSTSSKLWTTTQGEEMSLKSNLIDKSPPIGSIARILSWDDDSCTDNISKPAMRGVHEDEDWFLFIETKQRLQHHAWAKILRLRLGGACLVQVKDWLSDEYVEDIDANSVAAESLVKEEIVGRRWMHSFQAEIDDLGIGIERALLQELVEEAVLDLTQ
ncbi:hypothetical protein Rs2_49348 [Raphanus sativus]|nr:hypothetical protein Rs2_49348 [Raphanus sativus]